MPQKQSVFVIEDDQDIRHLVENILSKNGYVVAGSESAELGLKRIPSFKPSLIILDFELPGMDGLECCKRVRANPAIKSIPIILLSVHSSEVYKITALESGADDFVTKPFSHGELLARVKAVLRRTGKGEPGKSQAVKDKLFELDRDKRTVFLKKRKLNLTPKEFSIMDLFLRAPGQVFSRDLLATQVWEQENLLTSRTIDVHLARLRKKLGRYGNVIQTVGKVGYRYEPMSR